MMNKIHVKKGDIVKVISGRGKKTEGKVLTVDAENGRIVVEGVKENTKHKRPRRAGETGGIVKEPATIDASNVKIVCPNCGSTKGIIHITEERKDGKVKYVRACKECKQSVEVKAAAKVVKQTKKNTKAAKSTTKDTATETKPKRTRRVKADAETVVKTAESAENKE